MDMNLSEHLQLRWTSIPNENGSTVPGLRGYDFMKWAEASQALHEAAVSFKKKYGRPVVLVIDSVDYVAKKDPKAFKVLTDWAKAEAEIGLVRVVFVWQDAMVPAQEMDNPARDRAKYFEVGDVPDKEAVDYLLRRGIPKEKAEEKAEEAVKTIAGGRMVDLLDYATRGKRTPDHQQFNGP